MDKFNRKTFLKGSGIALALPWLETFADEKSNSTPKRFVSIYAPDGVGVPLKEDPAYKDWSWFPQGGEKDFRLTKVLDVLEPLRNEISIYSGLSHPAGRKLHGHHNADQYLTAAATTKQEYKNSISLDQLYAKHIGQKTRHNSLVMSTNGGIGRPGRTHTQSFNAQGRPIPAMNNPKLIFDMLFKTYGKGARRKLARSSSSLDLLLNSANSMQKRLSGHDKETFQQYLDSVRDTEVKVKKARKWIDTPVAKVDQSNLSLMANTYSDPKAYLQTMYELIYLSFLSDSTRVATYMLGAENYGGPHDKFPWAIDIKLNAHGLTHEVKKPNGWERLGKYNRFQAQEFGRFIQKLKDTPEPNGNGNMLDNTIALHGSASSSFHLSRNYPIISAGGKNLGFQNGRYLKFGSGNEDNQAGAGIDTDQASYQSEMKFIEEDLGHLYVTILQRLGVEIDEFAGFKGGLERV